MELPRDILIHPLQCSEGRDRDRGDGASTLGPLDDDSFTCEQVSKDLTLACKRNSLAILFKRACTRLRTVEAPSFVDVATWDEAPR